MAIGCHTVVALFLIGAIELVEFVLTRTGEPALFGVLPLRYVFDAMDAAILFAFTISGSIAASRWFKE